jgi:hypothetical protein
MPSRTRTPDLPAVSGRVDPPATAEPARLPEAAHTRAAIESAGSGNDRPRAAGDGAGGDGAGGDGAGGEPAWGGLRLVAVPDGWPPYDCETHGAACSATASETGRQPPRLAAADEAGAGEAGATWNAVPASTGSTIAAGMAETGAGQTARLDQTPGRAPGAGSAARAGSAAGQNGGAGHAPGLSAAWPRQFAQVLVEILAGFRPAKQLAPWATERVRAQIDLLSCAADAEQRPRIRRVMTSRPTAGVVEMTMVVGFGSRSRALAMRFEHVPARPPVPGRPARPARWLCTEIETS